jgi:hypothetical protein
MVDGITVGTSLFVPPRTVPAAGWRKGVPRAMLFLTRPVESVGVPGGVYGPLGLEGRRLSLVRATNERGLEFPTSELVQTHTDREYEAELRVPGGSKSVNLTFALHRTRAVTFMTRPPAQ